MGATGIRADLEFLKSAAMLARSKFGPRHGHSISLWKIFGDHRCLAATAAALLAGTMGSLVFIRSLSSGYSVPWNGRTSSSSSLLDAGESIEEEELFVPGLVNTGNTCFLNAILQALASSKKIVEFLALCVQDGGGPAHKAFGNKSSVMPLAVALHGLLQELSQLRTKKEAASPRKVMLALDCYGKNFNLAMQQDAAEALSHLSSVLEEEQLETFEKHIPSFQSFSSTATLKEKSSDDHCRINQDIKDTKIALESWKQQRHWPMEGTLGSSVICSQCGFQFSVQFQFFKDIPLSPPTFDEQFIVEGTTLEQCLDQFTAFEHVSGVRCNRCSHLSAIRCLAAKREINKDAIKIMEECDYEDRCSCEFSLMQQGGTWNASHVDAYKSLHFGRCPEVLCLQIQRVRMSSSGEMRKLIGHVSFPMVLDLYGHTMTSQKSFCKIPQFRPCFYNGRGTTLNQLQVLRNGNHYGDIKSRLVKAQTQRPVMNFLDRNNSSSAAVLGLNHLESAAGILTRHFNSIVGEHEDKMPCSRQSLPGKDETPQDSQTRKGLPPTQLYELVSVVVHHGNSRSGHYSVYRRVVASKLMTSMVQFATTKGDESSAHSVATDDLLPDLTLFDKKGGSRGTCDLLWFQISDTNVEKVTLEQVLAADATLLFYERCS